MTNSPLTKERVAIHKWIRDDLPLAGKMNLTSAHVDALVEKLNAARSEAQSVGVPDGWVLVPREPTEEMIEHGMRTVTLEPGSGDEDEEGDEVWTPARVYRAMLSALSPVGTKALPPEGQQSDGED